MNTKKIRILSFLLMLTLLLSCVPIFVSAAEGDVETTLIYHRNFEEGWAHTNGLNDGTKGNNVFIDYEESDDFSYNYFMRFEALTANDGFMEFRYKSNQPKEGGSVYKFDIMTDDYTNMGNIMYLRTVGGSTDGETTNFLGIFGGVKDGVNVSELWVPNSFSLSKMGTTSQYAALGGMPSNKFTVLDDRWVTVAICYDFDEENLLDKNGNPEASLSNYRACLTCRKLHLATATGACGGQTVNRKSDGTLEYKACSATLDASAMYQLIRAKIYIGYKDTFDPANAKNISDKAQETYSSDLAQTKVIDVAFCVKPKETRGIDIVRMGFPASSTQEKLDNIQGQSYCIDNLSVYNGEPYKILSEKELLALGQGYGTVINGSAAKTIEILKGTGEKSDMQYINEALVMKVGVDYELSANKKMPIFGTDTAAYGAPVKKDGTVFVPLEAVLSYMGYPCFPHVDAKSYDFATDKGSALITDGRDVATVNGEVIALTAAPWTAKDPETGAPYIVVALDDIEKFFDNYFVTYDSMGLIFISEKDNIVNRDTDLQLMIEVMCKFIYDYKNGDDIYAAIQENTNNFTHPFIQVEGQQTFDYYRQVYTGAVDDPKLKEYLDAVVESATPSLEEEKSTSVRVGNTYIQYKYGWNAWKADGVTVDTTGDGPYLSGKNTEIKDSLGNVVTILNGQVINPQADKNYVAKPGSVTNGNGYDWDGGRLNEAAEYAELIRLYALCYQITGKEAYGRMAYEVAIALSKWDHWGPRHFLNCADTVAAYATAYDWMYNQWKAWYGASGLTPIEDAIYEKGIEEGRYVSGIATGTPEVKSPFLRGNNKGVAAYYTTMENNWNVVCTSGMAIGSLVMMGVKTTAAAEGRSKAEHNTYLNGAKELISSNLKTLTQNGLDMYAPDGSYIESPNYWVYSTNTLYQMIWALNTAAGTDFGLTNTWGLDKTFYYACQVEFPSFIRTDSDTEQMYGYQFWNYHDSNQDPLDTCMFFYAAQVMGQDSIAAIRIEQLARKKVTIYDVLGYKKEYVNLDIEEALDSLDKTYVFESCDAIVSRDHFGDGALYTGLMGNMNNASHGQVDSGNFIYANKNYVWFCDLGADDYNVYGYFGNNEYRYAYYRMNAEGANVVAITSSDALKFGQVLDGGGKLISYESNEYGMKAILDNAGAYGTIDGDAVANIAKRGILFTNNRSTVVIQDEIVLSAMQSMIWLGQTAANIKISDDKTTAWLYKTVNGKQEIIRCTIVPKGTDSSLTFSVMTANEFVLSNTMKPGKSEDLGGVAEKDRSQYKRLCINAGTELRFECAVVIEYVTDMTSTDNVGYTWTEMNDWVIKKEPDATVDGGYVIGNANPKDIQFCGGRADELMQSGEAFKGALDEFFYNMMKSALAVKYFENMIKGEPVLKAAYDKYLVNVQKYERYKESINDSMYAPRIIGESLGGYYL